MSGKKNPKEAWAKWGKKVDRNPLKAPTKDTVCIFYQMGKGVCLKVDQCNFKHYERSVPQAEHFRAYLTEKEKKESSSVPVSNQDSNLDLSPRGDKKEDRVYQKKKVYQNEDETDLKSFIKSFRAGQNIPQIDVKCLMYQLCKGMDFCHGHRVLLRDLKPHDLLLDRKKMTLKIADDLGLAIPFTLPMKKYRQGKRYKTLALGYRAPEVLLGATHYSTAVDMWSVGCIFVELVTKRAIFAADSEFQQLLRIFSLLGTPNEQVWPGVSTLKDWHEYPQWKPKCLSKAVPNLDETGLDLLSKMLEYEPAKRISAKKAMEHAYFKDGLQRVTDSQTRGHRKRVAEEESASKE